MHVHAAARRIQIRLAHEAGAVTALHCHAAGAATEQGGLVGGVETVVAVGEVDLELAGTDLGGDHVGVDALLLGRLDHLMQHIGEARQALDVHVRLVVLILGQRVARELRQTVLQLAVEQVEWRNFYLTGAQELRNGVAKLPTPNTASPDTVRAMSLDLFFDYLGVRLNAEKAGDAKMTLNFDFGSEGKYLLELENGVLNNTSGRQADNADATVTLDRASLDNIMLGETTLDKAVADGKVKVTGDSAKLGQLVSMLDTFEFWFNIVTP